MANIKNIIDKETKMTNINMIEGKVVAPEGMTVGIVASRFNEVIVNKLLNKLKIQTTTFKTQI